MRILKVLAVLLIFIGLFVSLKSQTPVVGDVVGSGSSGSGTVSSTTISAAQIVAGNSGTDDYTGCTTPTTSTLTDGTTIVLVPDVDNDTDATLDLCSLGAVPIFQNSDGIGLDSLDVRTGEPIFLQHCSGCDSGGGAWLLYGVMPGFAKNEDLNNTLQRKLSTVSSVLIGDGSGDVVVTFDVASPGVDVVCTASDNLLDCASRFIADVIELGTLQWIEDEANGDNFRAFAAPAALTADLIMTWANSLPSANAVLGFDDGTDGASTQLWLYPGTRKVSLGMVGCSGTTATILWDTLASGAPTAGCSAGSTNTAMMRGILGFPNSGVTSVQRQDIVLPPDWTGAVDVRFIWQTAATANEVVWQVQAVCVDDAEVNDVAWPTANTVEDTAKGTTLQTNEAAITGITTTGCSAGDLMHLRILRDADHANDDLADTANLITVELTLRRGLTAQ